LRVLVILFVVVAIGPAIIVDALARVLDRRRLRQVLRTRVARCDAQHPVELVGAWTCPSCHAPFEGHGFGPCPHCGEVAYGLPCPCSRIVVNPLAEIGP